MKSRWSQNFLIDKNIARQCVKALDLKKQDTVLEIGPGRGILTELLLQKAKKVIAVEIDSSLCDFLKNTFAYYKNLTLIQKDFLELDIKQKLMKLAFPSPSSSPLGGEGKGEGKFKAIGNLPYAVVSPILQKICSWKNWERTVFMVQKEVGERIRAEPGTKSYGILSISIQSRCKVEKISLVSRNCFRPIPEVDSMVLRLSSLGKPSFHPIQEKYFFKIVKAAFAHRRKTILNSMALALKLSPFTIEEAIQNSGLSTQARAETISIADFVRICKNLKEADILPRAIN